MRVYSDFIFDLFDFELHPTTGLASRLQTMVSFDNGATWQYSLQSIFDLVKRDAASEYESSRVRIVQIDAETGQR